MIQILFICLGNICRSPMAEAIFSHQVYLAGLNRRIKTDSAGTSNYHPGKQADHRTRQILKNHGITTTHSARQILHQDFKNFQYILAMDHQNLENLSRVYRQMHEPVAKLELIGHYEPDQVTPREVPDPYYGELEDFEEVYQMLEPACAKLLDTIRRTCQL